MKFQMESPIPSKSNKLLVFEDLTFLFVIYLAMKLSEPLMILESDVICSIDLWRDIEWKLPLQRSGLVGEFGSYGSWILITSLSSPCGVLAYGTCLLWFALKTCSGLEWVALLFPAWSLMLLVVLFALLTWFAFSCSVS